MILLRFFLIVMVVVFIQSSRRAGDKFVRFDTLSEYGFFEGQLKELNPREGIIPYDLNTPLFSNYAEKIRFVKIPEGTSATYNDSVVFNFPIGTILIKNFLYPNDFRKPEKGRRIVETRLLVLEEKGWNALPYIWNEEQTDAVYDPAGETLSISYVNEAGKKIKTPYVIPNKNQCKGCHLRDSKLMPIGLAARHLNKMFSYASGNKNQLSYWNEKNLLKGLPGDHQLIPQLVDFKDPTSPIDDRARAYLDINCGHCHSRLGPASTSGLFLDIHEKEKSHLGINKSPVAAGRGSGNLQYDIVPGQPQHSILVFRMKSLDPAIAMPEIGREQIHSEGVALIEEWIRKMPAP